MRVSRRTAAPGLGFIDNVVVNQRGRVEIFDHGSQARWRSFFVGKELGRQQQQCRTYSLATAGAQMLADISDGADV